MQNFNDFKEKGFVAVVWLFFFFFLSFKLKPLKMWPKILEKQQYQKSQTNITLGTSSNFPCLEKYDQK